ncbi:hypothetical protein MBLNU13_g01433t2 [Cladosporium sp. NU13]
MASRKELQQFNNVQLPITIPCNDCKIQKKQNQYSAKRLADLQKQIVMAKKNKRAFDPKSEGFVRCSLCVGGPKVEHECYHCEVTFPRNDKYFSKSMLKNRKDEAREQNETLSSDEDDGGSYSGSDDSGTTFITNQFQDLDTRSTTSGSTSAYESNGFSSRDNSSGGVRLNNSKTPSTGGGTIYAGSASNICSSRAATTSASVAPSLNTHSSSRIGYAPTVASSGSAIAGRRAAFTPNAYGSPRRRSPTGSEASGSTARSGSTFAKIKKGRTVVDMDAVREQHKDMRHEAAKKAKDVEVSDSESD